jgi:hypothetical protein
MKEKTKFEELVDVLADALFEMLLERVPKNDTNENGDKPQDAA